MEALERRPEARAIRLADGLYWLLAGAAVFALATLALELTARTGRVAAIWPANAVVLVSMIRARREVRPGFLAAGLIGNVLADLAMGDDPSVAVGLSLCNTLEIFLCALGLVVLSRARREQSGQRDVWTFGLLATAASLASALAASAVLGWPWGSSGVHRLVVWALADALGLMILTPALLALAPDLIGRRLARGGLVRNLALLGLFAAVVAGVFVQDRYPLLFVVSGALLVLVFHLETLGAALGILITAVVSVALTLAGHGPMTLISSDLAERVLLLQSFLAISVVMGFPVAAILAQRRRLKVSLADSERYYRLLADNATDVILRVDRQDTVLYVSPSCRQYGWEPEQLLGRSGFSLVHPDDVAHLHGLIADLFSGAPVDPTANREYRVRTGDGGYVWMEGNPAIVRDARGAPIEVISQLRDVTLRREMEEELRRKRKEAEAAADAKSEFLANMSHEIRTPLTGIIGFAGLLEELDDLSPDARRYVQRVNTASHSLLSVVNDILDFSKLQAGHVELDPLPFDPSLYIGETLELVAAQVEAKGLRLRLRFDHDLPHLVLADAPRLRQVLLNLLTNAVKFTAEGSITVCVDYRPGAPDQLRIEVSDTGPGIAPDAVDRLFQRFTQVDGSISRSHGGTGLGLAICKSLAALMGGEIGVDSREGQGSTFWFTIAAPVAEAGGEAATEAAGEVDMIPASILIVDDVAVNRELVGVMLEPFGHALSEAESGAEAVRAALTTRFDLILMDLQMPGMDGYEATRAIRASGGYNSHTPIVALSANVLPEHVAACTLAAIDDHIGKPIQPAELVEKVIHWTAVGRERGLVQEEARAWN